MQKDEALKHIRGFVCPSNETIEVDLDLRCVSPEAPCCQDPLPDEHECWEVEAGYADPNLPSFSSSAQRRGSKAWVAKIEGSHPKYKFQRNFLPTTAIEGTKRIDVRHLTEDDLLERVRGS